MAVRTRSILIVEELAHWDNGHFPVRCAQLAEAYAELGYRVELLTSEGWSRDAEHPQPPFAVRRYRRVTRWVRRWLARGDRRARHQLLTLALVLEARAAARQMVPTPDAIVVLGWYTDPAVLALTGGRVRWLVNQFRTPRDFSTVRTPAGRWLERRRRVRGGCVRVAVAHEQRRTEWNERVPYLDPVVVPIAGTRRVEREPDARKRLGLPAGRLALLFGEPALKQRDLVFDALAPIDDWTLVVGGPIADGIEDATRLLTFPGVLPDETRDLLFSAVDLVVLAFRTDYRNNSGTLMDAISIGVPVVCSDDAAVAQIVTRYRLGTTFHNGDPADLARAVHTAPRCVARDDLEVARRELLNSAVARRQLVVLGIVPPVSRAAIT
jgi:glycosyltransferase involved in cell wall biosynthesis